LNGNTDYLISFFTSNPAGEISPANFFLRYSYIEVQTVISVLIIMKTLLQHFNQEE
jgi:hypothetical protein